MTDVREAIDNLLTEKPDFESDLRELLAVDERQDGWSFDEVPLDSGTFGELVSRNIVAKDGDEYEIADPNAVRASLDGESSIDGDIRQSWNPSALLSSLSFPSVSRTEAGALAGALAFVVLMRTYIFPSVFRGKYVVLSSNDPYYYRYWVERLAVEATGVFDLSVLSGLPGPVAKGEPLMVATLWWITNLFGGAGASGWVLAWYPVISAVVVAVLVYAMAVRVTGDRRVGLASVAFLAVIPAFAYRTGLGFADHHAFDYPWLALTALALVWLADVDRDDLSDVRTWVAAVVLGVAVWGQAMAWEAGPLLISAVGLYVAVQAIADVRADRSPLPRTAPILVGLALASVLSYLTHTGFGWHTDIVTYAPVLLLVGIVGVTFIAEAIRRAGMPASVLGVTEVAGALSGLVLLQIFLPGYWRKLTRRTSYLLFRAGPAETRSLFAGGPSGFFLGPILELGFAWVIALPVLALLSWRAYRRNQQGWLIVTTYGWYFLVLATFQRRFVGELAPFVAVLAGWGFVVLAAKLDVTHMPTVDRERTIRATDGGRSIGLPSREAITALAILLLFVTSAGAAQTAVRHEQVKIGGDKFEAAVWMDSYAEERGWEYPENYVLSKWGRNRMYNYFVNGEARTYGYASRHYEAFLSSTNPKSKYRELHERVGFVVTKQLSQNRIPPETNYARLHQRFGSVGPNGASGAGHYRAVYASKDGSVKVFTLVPGANITGTAPANATLTVSTSVDIEGASFKYSRKVEAKPDDNFSVTVPYPGTYSVENQTVQVPESAVQNGSDVSVEA
ncbi:STT3 domain-containing protein [Halorussus sp. AFM4]|uniref:STT3 domain-containing protein n=1 Tax=Halorussus sp. AFM4 TaxID=3421651 RepID=UPI003EB78624